MNYFNFLLPDSLKQIVHDAHLQRGKSYRGRFAPSPSGTLHLGNLRTALLSWLKARSVGGEWFLRIDDIDRPRNCPGAIESLQSDLLWLGLSWDGPVIFQSDRLNIYELVISTLKDKGLIYPCYCSRSILMNERNRKIKKFIYPGTCREQNLPWDKYEGRFPSLRLRVSAKYAQVSGDLILRRSDNYIAYNLATVVDEILLGITEVVRGNDLHEVKSSQLAIMDILYKADIKYKHVPLLMNEKGIKLSKRDSGFGLDSLRSQGKSSSQCIGYLASSIGLVENDSSLSAEELLKIIIDNKKDFESLFR